ncbi:hypothetical protein N7476_007298 [Penicillium atrosanguineum]|uniref:Uncharacterized protein n=1 Tax=Penicillium atrosanguineum TaxID=1132637 RepID=A0A9W9U3D0_9EURO|nr:hypothetical protein N7476_007298 [Penicillium atrosanguineum]
MKSFIYIITAILPLASQMAMASPVAEPDEFSLKERGNGGNGWGNEHGNGHDRDHGNYHQRPEDFCKVQKTYWYHKYPCDSSETVGESNVGDTFAPVCKYQYDLPTLLSIPGMTKLTKSIGIGIRTRRVGGLRRITSLGSAVSFLYFTA